MLGRYMNMAAAAVFGVVGGAGSASAEMILLGASKPGHSAYNIVVAYSQAIAKSVPDLDVSVQASGGSIDAISFLQTGRVHAAPVGAAAPYAAYLGLEPFEGKAYEDVRTWLPMYSWAAQLVVPAESDIQSWEDLRGKRVAVGPIGSSGENYSRDILAAMDITYDDIAEFRVAQAEAIEGLKSGQLDAVIESSGFPTPGVLEVMAGKDIRIVPLEQDVLKRIDDAYPLYSAGKIPAGVYPGIDEDIAAVVGYTIMVIAESVSEEAVYGMTKAIWENLDDIKSSHASQALLSPEMIRPALEPVAPIHPGAMRYYKERGWF